MSLCKFALLHVPRSSGGWRTSPTSAGMAGGVRSEALQIAHEPRMRAAMPTPSAPRTHVRPQPQFAFLTRERNEWMTDEEAAQPFFQFDIDTALVKSN